MRLLEKKILVIDARNQQRPNKDQLLAAMDVAGIAAWQYDVKKKKLLFSPQMESLHGFIPNTWTKHSIKSYLSLIHSEDQNIVAKVFNNAKGNEIGYKIVYRIVWPDKSIHWLSCISQVVLDKKTKSEYITGICTDITEQQELEENIRKSERQLQSIIDGSTTIIYVKDIKERYQMINRQYELLFHIDREKIKGKTDLEIWPRDIAETFIENDKLVLSEERAIEFEERMPQEDGMHTYISSKFPLYDNRGLPYAICGISTDITETKKLEERKDEFISMASHELKTPLTSIKGFTQILQKISEKNNYTEAYHYLERMDIQIDKLTKLITDLLDVSKMQQGKLRLEKFNFDIDTMVHDTIEVIQPIADTHKIVLRGEAKTIVFGDRDRISQVLLNLLTNAVKYSPKAKKIVVTVLQDTDLVSISVQDYGVGIPKTHQHKIFERFYRVYDATDKTFPGLGIGLYISFEIIKRHGGHMWVESKKGKGSTFYFSLPIKRRK